MAKGHRHRERSAPIELLGGSSVPVHLVAEQYYCEYKVHLELSHPDIAAESRDLPGVSDRLARGKEFHDSAAAEAKEVAREEIQRRIQTGLPFTLVESTLQGRYNDLPLIGRPDAIHFDGQGAAWVIDYKVRSQRKVFGSDEVQLRCYALLLGQDHLLRVPRVSLCAVLVSGAGADKVRSLPKRRFVTLASTFAAEPPTLGSGRFQDWSEHRPRGLGPIHCVNFRFDKQKVRSELQFAQAYWLGLREPVPTKKAAKCRSCSVNALGMCSRAQADYRGS